MLRTSVLEAFGCGGVSSTWTRLWRDFLQACVRNMSRDVIALKLNVALCLKNSSFSSSNSGASAKKSLPVVVLTARYFSSSLRRTRNPHIEACMEIMWNTALEWALVEFADEVETLPERERAARRFPKMATPLFSCRKKSGSAWLLNMRNLCSSSDNCSPKLWTWTRPERRGKKQLFCHSPKLNRGVVDVYRTHSRQNEKKCDYRPIHSRLNVRLNRCIKKTSVPTTFFHFQLIFE